MSISSSGNIGAVRFDKGDVSGRRFRLDHDGLKMRKRFGGLELLLNVIHRQVQPVGNLRQQMIELDRIVPEQQNAEGGIVIHDDAAITIQHGAARSDDGDRSDAVAFRKLRIAIGVDDLQLPKAQKQQGH